MIRRDFHGWFSQEVRREVDRIVADVRRRDGEETVEFITGRGPLRKLVISILSEYGISSHFQIGNDGVIVATIE